MKMTPVTSSNIAAIGHCSDTDQLAIKFNNGKTFIYSEVSEDEWGSLMRSCSIGKHFNQFIKAVKIGREVVTAENDETDERDAAMSDAPMSDKEKIKVLREALELIVKIADFPPVDRAILKEANKALEATKDGE